MVLSMQRQRLQREAHFFVLPESRCFALRAVRGQWLSDGKAKSFLWWETADAREKTMRYMEFKKDGDQVGFYLFGDKMYAAEKVAVAYDKGTKVMLFHGTPEMAAKWKERQVADLRSRFMSDVIRDLVLVEVDASGVNDLNEVVSQWEVTQNFAQRWEDEESSRRYNWLGGPSK